jgi:hypothetical protein
VVSEYLYGRPGTKAAAASVKVVYEAERVILA